MTINLAAHVEHLLTLHAAGLLTRRKWTGTHADGRAMTSMLAALAPETGVARSASACPAEVMPKWMAHMVVWLDEVGQGGAWEGLMIRTERSVNRWHVLTSTDWRRLDFAARDEIVKRFAGIARQWHVLSDADWRRLEFQVCAICVREAASHAEAEETIDICARGAALYDRAAAGDEPTPDEWSAVSAAARAADLTAAETAYGWDMPATTAHAAAAASEWAPEAASNIAVAIFSAIETRIAIAEA